MSELKDPREILFNKAKSLFEQEGCVLCQFATGVGKTKVALELAHVDEEPWQILVPKVSLIKTWKDEMIKWGFENLLSKVNIICYASAHKLPVGHNNTILDEAHRITDRNFPFIRDFVGDAKLICLSATIPEKKRELLEQLGINHKNSIKYGLNAAVKDDIIADYHVKIIQFPLDDKTKNIQAGKKGAYYYVTEKEGYAWKEEHLKFAIKTGNPKLIKFRILNRMHFIHNLPSKLAAAKEILQHIPEDKKVIVFCGSINHANMVCNHRYHSKTNDQDYNDFCDGNINQLSAVQSISEGVNIPELDYAILMQVQADSLHLIQKMGRLLRKSEDPEKVGKMIILEAIGTQDSKWIHSAIAPLDKSKVDYVSYQQVLNKGL